MYACMQIYFGTPATYKPLNQFWRLRFRWISFNCDNDNKYKTVIIIKITGVQFFFYN